MSGRKWCISNTHHTPLNIYPLTLIIRWKVLSSRSNYLQCIIIFMMKLSSWARKYILANLVMKRYKEYPGDEEENFGTRRNPTREEGIFFITSKVRNSSEALMTHGY